MGLDLAGLARATATPEPIAAAPLTATVVRADESGLWVVAAGDDPRHPVGPCRGGWTAGGTRVPAGALVMLVDTADGPWVVGFDNPALAVADGTLAPFANPSFEILDPVPLPGYPHRAAAWSDFWRNSNRPTQYDLDVEDGGAAHGLRSLRVNSHGGRVLLNSTSWSVPAGSAIRLSIYGRSEGDPSLIQAYLYTNTPGGVPGPFAPGAQTTQSGFWYPTGDWLRYETVVTLAAGHTELALFLDVGATTDGDISSVWVDNADADLVELDPAAAHQDYLRRATATLNGGGSRVVTAGGNISWSQPLTIAGAGLSADEAPDGRYEISMPPNGTVVAVHQSTARTSHTIAGGVIALNPDDALWYELPIGQPAASQPARFHIIGSSNADGYVVPPHFVLVVRRGNWSSSHHAPEYVWGDHVRQDPWRTPAFNSGWIAGTITPRFTKTGDGQVRMKGRVRSGAGSAFSLPSGYWPAETHTAIVRDGAGAAAVLTVTAAGAVTTSGNNTDHSIETTFVAEQ